MRLWYGTARWCDSDYLRSLIKRKSLDAQYCGLEVINNRPLTAFFFFSVSAFFSAFFSAFSASASSFSCLSNERVPIFSFKASAYKVKCQPVCPWFTTQGIAAHRRCKVEQTPPGPAPPTKLYICSKTNRIHSTLWARSILDST